MSSAGSRSQRRAEFRGSLHRCASFVRGTLAGHPGTLNLPCFNDLTSATLVHQSCFSDVPDPAQDPETIQAILDAGTAPLSSELLSRLILAHNGAKGSLPDEAAWPTRLTLDAATAMRAAALSVRTAALALPADAAVSAEPLRSLAVRLLGDLCLDTTLSALAEAARFVREQLWPAVQSAPAEVAATAGSDSLPVAEVEGVSPAVVAAAAKPRKRVGMINPSSAATPPARTSCQTEGGLLLSTICLHLGAVLQMLAGAEMEQAAPHGGSSDSSAIGRTDLAAAATRLAAGLKHSGLLSELCAAVTAAPCCELPAPDATSLAHFTLEMTTIQYNMTTIFSKLTRTHSLCGSPVVAELLAAPAVVRLHVAMLEQVTLYRAGSRSSWVEGGSGGAGGTGGEGEEEDDEGGPGSDDEGELEGSGGAGGAVACWPLLHPKTLRLSFGPKLQITEVLHSLVTSVISLVTVEAPVNKEAAAAASKALFPSLASCAVTSAGVARALCGRAEQLGRLGARERAGANVTPKDLVGAVMCMMVMMASRVGGAPPKEVAGCLPDLLVAEGWSLRMLTTPAGLVGAKPEYVASAVYRLGALVRGSSLAPPRLWDMLSPAAQGTCVERLLPTHLLCSMDRMLRYLAVNDAARGVAMSYYEAMGVLLTPLLRASLQRWQQRHLRRQQQQQQCAGAPATAVAADEGAAGTGGGSARHATHSGEGEVHGDGEADEVWTVQAEAGVLVTLAKLARQDVAHLSDGRSRNGSVPDLFKTNSPLTCTALLLASAGCYKNGLPSLLPLVTDPTAAAAQQGGYGGVGGVEWARTVATVRRGLGEMTDLCGSEALRAIAALSEEMAAFMKRPGSASSMLKAVGGPNGQPILSANVKLLARSVLWITCSCSPAALVAAVPQRTLVVMAQLAREVEKRMRRLGGAAANPAVASDLQQSSGMLALAVMVLTSDEALRVACVPGWLWGVPLPRGSVDQVECGLEHLSQLTGPDYAAICPIVRVHSAAAAPLAGKIWRTDREASWPMVMALARKHLQTCGAFSVGSKVRWWSESFARRDGAGGGSEEALWCWPPRSLRLCNNPGCGDFGAASEGELNLKKCWCRAVRYCGPACQKEHWHAGHKVVCM
ncbi:hypothetical protein TSOC_012540 [Tetrabaena socialis]|uniref:MYND-type domain-containing protein n=1 Tax=Tetrabaena socialis TaxID=47790 RepID=A0A2J7ZMS9_9CHLO|nr:hypothetical protein TSOC_012540 [Tetrabaena socialis]|eukprot:PNH01566.1 hypothetical protein TSOC_012540 [Tetrabaena socialis]